MVEEQNLVIDLITTTVIRMESHTGCNGKLTRCNVLQDVFSLSTYF